jgi:hypothetical protein
LEGGNPSLRGKIEASSFAPESKRLAEEEGDLHKQLSNK